VSTHDEPSAGAPNRRTGNREERKCHDACRIIVFIIEDGRMGTEKNIFATCAMGLVLQFDTFLVLHVTSVILKNVKIFGHRHDHY
jgi:hypothetical protein